MSVPLAFFIWALKLLITHTVIFILILIVCPSLKPRSRAGDAEGFSDSSSTLSHLKWSWRATFKSKLSDRSPNPRPIYADRPANRFMSQQLANLVHWLPSDEQPTKDSVHKKNTTILKKLILYQIKNISKQLFYMYYDIYIKIQGVAFQICLLKKREDIIISPASSSILTTKYLEESVTDSIARPGYLSIGHLANICPDTLSSSLRMHSFPLETTLIRPVQSGVARFQSAALK